jgi:outer membrane protein OmpA-like peptidoglycan-associated protein
MSQGDSAKFESDSDKPKSDNIEQSLNTLKDLLSQLIDEEDREKKQEREEEKSSLFLDLEEMNLITEQDSIQPAISQKIEKNFKETKLFKPIISVDRSERSDLRQLIANLETKLNKLESQVYKPTELINPLLPLIKELLESKTSESKESILAAVVPVIDEIIRQKNQENPEQISDAVADILPAAISQEINKKPQAIAKAIAPEIAMAIQEQIKLDRDAIPTTIGPEIGRAIKVQIKEEQDSMVDALYPIIGNTISKYMLEMVKAIDERIEKAFTFKAIGRKIRAKLRGVSEAELILQEAMFFEVRAIFLIQKTSGLLIAEVQPSSSSKLDSDMLAAMLTAIRSFVKDCVSQRGNNSELHQIDYDDCKIILEIAGYCYLAVVVRGEPSKSFIKKIRQILSRVILNYDRTIERFNGDREKIPTSLQSLLEELCKPEKIEREFRPLIALTIFLLIVLSFWGTIFYRGIVARRIETKIATALDATPELSIYRIFSRVNRGKLYLAGKVPNDRLRSLAAQIVSKIAPDLEIDNRIIAVEVPSDPVLTAAEVRRVTAIFNQREEIDITTKYREGTVTVEGDVLYREDAERISQGFQQIPGINTVVTTAKVGRIFLKTRIYFEFDSTQLQSQEDIDKISSLKQFLDRHPKVRLNITGYTDLTGQETRNQELAKSRATAVQKILIDRGIARRRLQSSGSLKLPPNLTPDQPLWLRRCVIFEAFISP